MAKTVFLHQLYGFFRQVFLAIILSSMGFFFFLKKPFSKYNLIENPTHIRDIELLRQRLQSLEPAQPPPQPWEWLPRNRGLQPPVDKPTSRAHGCSCLAQYMQTASHSKTRMDEILGTFSLSPNKNQKENTDPLPHTHTPCNGWFTLIIPAPFTWSSGSHWWGLPLGQEVSQLCLFHRGQFSCKKFMNS